MPYNLYAYDSYGTQTGSDYSNDSFSSYKGYDKGPFGYKTGVRQYDPETGRFLSPDTFKGYLTDPASQHPYMYCHGNPVKFSDPSGYFTWPAEYNGLRIAIEPNDSIKDINNQLPGANFKKLKYKEYDVSYIYPKNIVGYIGKENPGSSCADFAYAFKEGSPTILSQFADPEQFMRDYILKEGSGYKKTGKPHFGDVAVFYNSDKAVHIAIYLSRDMGGKRWTIGQLGVGGKIQAQPEEFTRDSPAIKATRIEFYRR